MQRPVFLLTAGIVLALLGDSLLRPPLGMDFPLWVGAFLFVSARATSISPIHSGLSLPILFFAGCVAWRDSEFLTVSNTLAVLGLAMLPHVQHAGIVLRNALVSDYTRGVKIVLGHIWLGATKYFTVELPDAVAASPWQRRGMSMVIGIGLAIPVVGVFGVLYSSADPTFGTMFQSVANISPAWLFDHLIFTGAIAVASIGYLRGLMLPSAARDRADLVRGPYGIVELAIPLGGLIVLSAAFILFQLQYMFGDTMVRSAAGPTYADYARRGFFELTTAAALVVPLLLGADRLLRHTPVATRIFRLLAITQITLVGILMTSALHRMGLYWDAYGLTTTRVYATSFMLWIGTVLAWFATTVLRGRRRPFAFGALVSGLVVLAALNFANPEHIVARVNIARSTSTQPFDTYYLTQLSADAYPALINSLSDLPAEDRCHVLSTLSSKLNGKHSGWRSWSLSKNRARRAFENVNSSNGARHCSNPPTTSAQTRHGTR